VQRLRLGAGEPESAARVLIAELEHTPRDIGNGEMSGVELARAPSGDASRPTRCSSDSRLGSGTGATSSASANASTSTGADTNTFSVGRRRHQPNSEDRQLEPEAFAGVGIQIPGHIPPLVVKVRVRAVVTRKLKRPRLNGASKPCARIAQYIQVRNCGVGDRKTQ
jgi:hypothetical protein